MATPTGTISNNSKRKIQVMTYSNIIKDIRAGTADILPGMALQVYKDGNNGMSVRPMRGSQVAKQGFVAIALERSLFGSGVDGKNPNDVSEYSTVGNMVEVWFPTRGDLGNVIIASAGAVVAATPLGNLLKFSNADGCWIFAPVAANDTIAYPRVTLWEDSPVTTNDNGHLSTVMF